jgi:hypothetical protein
MKNHLYEEVRKEVINKVLGDTIGTRLEGSAPYLFKERYYDKIIDNEKRELVKKALLDILTTKYIFSRKKLRCFAAYISSDIGLVDAKSHIERLASDKSVQNSCLLLLLERALEKFRVHHRFSEAQLSNILLCQIFGKYKPVHTRGEEFYDFKKHYYDKIFDSEKRNRIKKLLLKLLKSNHILQNNRRRIIIAYVASDVGVEEAKSIIEDMLQETSIQKNSLYPILELALKKFKQ